MTATAAKLEPTKTVTCTVTKVPDRVPQRKTIRRLMRMQPDVQRKLSKLRDQRRRVDNKPTRRAGQIWINRATTTKVTHIGEGEQFTLYLTPQIIDDIRSVEQFLEIKSA